MWTAADLDLAPFQSMVTVHDDFARPPLATDRVRFVGEAIVAVLADTVTQAKDAADMVIVDYEPLPAAVTPEAALADGAPILFEAHGDNVALSTTDPVDDDLFGDADVIVRGRYVNQRIAVAPMEPHAAATTIDDRRTAAGLRLDTDAAPAAPADGQRARHGSESRSRVVTPLVGGGFGGKAGIYPEQVVVAAAAPTAAAARCVWVGDAQRRHGRAVAQPRRRSSTSSSAASATARSPGCASASSATAAPTRASAAFLPAGTRRMSNGTYRFPAIQFDVAVAVTNTTPMGAYRGAGRPEATALLERIVDQAAHRAGHRPDRAAPAQPARPTTCSRSRR